MRWHELPLQDPTSRVDNGDWTRRNRPERITRSPPTGAQEAGGVFRRRQPSRGSGRRKAGGCQARGYPDADRRLGYRDAGHRSRERMRKRREEAMQDARCKANSRLTDALAQAWGRVLADSSLA